MVYAIGLYVAALLLAQPVLAELDLTPHETEYEGDGLRFKHLAFRDNDKQVTYAPPAGWDYAGNPNRLVLHPPGNAHAEATISISTLERAQDFNESTLKKLTDEVLVSALTNGTDITLLTQQRNPLLINRKETFLVCVKYKVGREDYICSVIFLNRGREQLRSQLICRELDFKDLQRTFLGSQFSWQGL